MNIKLQHYYIKKSLEDKNELKFRGDFPYIMDQRSGNSSWLYFPYLLLFVSCKHFSTECSQFVCRLSDL